MTPHKQPWLDREYPSVDVPSMDVSNITEGVYGKQEGVSMKNILAKMQKLMESVAYIQKDKENSFHKYRYASEASIKAHVQPEMVKLGIVFKMEAEPGAGYEIIDTGKLDKNGYPNKIMVLWMRYTFYDVESGESITGLMAGTGEASDDKCVYKAITGAIKYALSSNLLFATGDDAEADDGSMPKPAAVPSKPITMADVKPQGQPQPKPAAPGRAPLATCPNCGKASVIKGREEYGGGWVCYKKTDVGGCGSKWTDEGWAAHQSIGQAVADVGQAFNPPKAVVDSKRNLMAAAMKHSAGSTRNWKGESQSVVVLANPKMYEAAEYAGVSVVDERPPFVVVGELNLAQMDAFRDAISALPVAAKPAATTEEMVDSMGIPYPTDADQ